MPVPISKSVTPLVFDTLPALKVQYYCGAARDGGLYTLARFYVLGDALALSLCVFEREAEPESLVDFCAGGAAGRYVQASLSSRAVDFALCGAQSREVLPPPQVSYFSGQDEQGWYWGGNFTLAKSHLQKAGVDLAAGGEFRANLVRRRSDEEAFGSAFPVPKSGSPFDPACFGFFEAVAY